MWGSPGQNAGNMPGGSWGQQMEQQREMPQAQMQPMPMQGMQGMPPQLQQVQQQHEQTQHGNFMQPMQLMQQPQHMYAPGLDGPMQMQVQHHQQGMGAQHHQQGVGAQHHQQGMGAHMGVTASPVRPSRAAALAPGPSQHGQHSSSSTSHGFSSGPSRTKAPAQHHLQQQKRTRPPAGHIAVTAPGQRSQPRRDCLPEISADVKQTSRSKLRDQLRMLEIRAAERLRLRAETAAAAASGAAGEVTLRQTGTVTATPSPLTEQAAR